MLASLVATAALLGAASPARVAPAPVPQIHYTIAMPDPASHLYTVTIDIGAVKGSVLKLQMPVWSPGRYARMDFAKNVQEFSVTDGNGKELRWDGENG